MSEKMWEPSEKRIESSLLNFFMIESPLDSDSYFDLHRWSIDNMEAFWSSFWNFSGIIYSKKYEITFPLPMYIIMKCLQILPNFISNYICSVIKKTTG